MVYTGIYQGKPVYNNIKAYIYKYNQVYTGILKYKPV
jgi:hypothetical protein